MFVTVREMAQVLSAVLAKVGPVALTEEEIQTAPMFQVEVPDGPPNRCILKPGEG
jgi:hypothetical protein